MPYLMQRLDNWIDQTTRRLPTAWVPNLKGQIVGNGNTQWKYDGTPAFSQMAFYHGLIDDELFYDFKDHCNLSFVDVDATKNLSARCSENLKLFKNYTSYAN